MPQRRPARLPGVRLQGRLAILLLTIACAGCAWMSEPPVEIAPTAEAYSLFGRPLVAIAPEGAAGETLVVRLARARADYARDSSNADALIWVARRTAYLGRYREALSLLSTGIAQHPDDPRMLRHRGHRYVTLRLFALAVEDLEAATRLIAGRPDQVEPDGVSNTRNIPTSTLQSNVWYHLGLAYYLQGHYENANRALTECLKVSGNPDQLCATTYWLWLSLTRLERPGQARTALEPIRPEMDIIENQDYHRLLLLYRGDPTRASTAIADTLMTAARRQGGVSLATVGYGVGAWHLARGERERAVARFREVMAGGTWAAFGFIAAEAELHRMGLPPE